MRRGRIAANNRIIGQGRRAQHDDGGEGGEMKENGRR
jgi:hypothetical protein